MAVVTVALLLLLSVRLGGGLPLLLRPLLQVKQLFGLSYSLPKFLAFLVAEGVVPSGLLSLPWLLVLVALGGVAVGAPVL